MSENIDKRVREDEFYAQKFYFSYSGLNRLAYAPQLFYRHYVLNQRDDVMTDALLQGKVIHCKLLDDGSFDKQFILLPGTIPGDNAKAIVLKIYEEWKELRPAGVTLKDYRTSIIAILKEINLHQSLTDDKKAPMLTGDDKRMDKIANQQNDDYFTFLKQSDGRDVVDIETLDYCIQVVDVLKQNSEINALLGLSPGEENIQVFNELPMQMELAGKPFGLKGILDNVKVDFDKKTIQINDLKTTSKSISDFQESVEYWNLWMQAAIYDTMVRETFLRADGIDESEWTVEFTFIVVDKYIQMYPFKVTPESMVIWKAKLEQKIMEAEWHYMSRNYSLPFIFATSQVTL